MSLMFARTYATIKPHVPMIKFRKGGPSLVNVSSPAATEQQTAPAAASGPAVYEWWELPAKFRRQPIDQAECDVINMGGGDKIF